MSIETENPKTVLEKLDAAANFVEQMGLAHMIKDEAHFNKAKQRAGDLLFDAIEQIQKEVAA